MRISAATMRLIAEEQALMQEFQRQCFLEQENVGVVARQFSKTVRENICLADEMTVCNYVESKVELQGQVPSKLYPDLSDATLEYTYPVEKLAIAKHREVRVLKKHLTEFKELYNKNFHEINELKQRNRTLIQETELFRKELGIYKENVEILTEQNETLIEEKTTLFKKLAYCKLKLNKYRARGSLYFQRYRIDTEKLEDNPKDNKTADIDITFISLKENTNVSSSKPVFKGTKKTRQSKVSFELKPTGL